MNMFHASSQSSNKTEAGVSKNVVSPSNKQKGIFENM